ncbi:hypothetical protein [Pantoea stewartii]|uniref:hypothetical protein n=1 Tax=Pantoea stewartii TaxID=66269 RepID=UPI00336678B5
MSRSAEDTIKGFVYQFHKTAKQILVSEMDAEIALEGAIEDIDIKDVTGEITAIQCKYHESQDKFVPSLIFKAILQMALNMIKHPNTNIKFILFIHTPDYNTQNNRKLTLTEFDSALNSQQDTIKKIAAQIPSTFPKTTFVASVDIEFAPHFDELSEQVKEELGKIEINNSDVNTILYPNIINHVALISTRKDPSSRNTTKKDVIDFLRKTNDIAISKWTLFLKSRDMLLRAKRTQLLEGLKLNTRMRCFYFKERKIENINDEIVIFIKNYIDKYHFKALHTKTPTFVLECDFTTLLDIQHRLYQKKIIANTGYIGCRFEEANFNREPLTINVTKSQTNREFDVRLLMAPNDIKSINVRKNDDIFLISDYIPDEIDTQDVQIFLSGVESREELEYILNIRSNYEK